MNFFTENWYLFALAVASGAMLFVPELNKRSATGSAPISPTSAVNLINREKAVVIDVRDAAAYAAGHIGRAKHIPLAELEAKLPQQMKNKNVPVILVCDRGVQSARAQAQAAKLGYEKSYNLTGGMNAWLAANLPIEKSLEGG